MDIFLRDLRYSFRGLRKSSGFAAVVILTLGLGIGATTSVFSIMESVLLRPLPFDAPDRLMAVWTMPKDQSTKLGASGPEFQDYKEQSRSFEYIANVLPRFTITWTGQGEPRTVHCTGISPDFFSLLGVKPLMGRLYSPEEYHVDGVQVVISQQFWKEQLNSDPNVLGRTLDLDGTAQTVIGVMPSLPDLFPDTDVWTKNVPDFDWMQMRGNKFLTVMGRLKPDVSRQQAEQELTAILHRDSSVSPELSIHLIPLRDELVGKVRSQLEIVMGAVGLVLLITCVNVAYLLVARNSRRQSEIAVRWSMGASRARILRQFMTENLVLAFMGGLLGLLLAYEGAKLLTTLNLGIVPRASTTDLDGYVLGFALGITLLTSLFLAWAPSFAFANVSSYAILKTGRALSGTMAKGRFRVLLVSEVTLTVILMVGAGLLVRSFWQVAHIDVGFQPENLLVSYLRTNDYPDGRKFFPEMLRRSAEIQGVQASAVSDCLPAGRTRSATVKFNDRPNDPYKAPTVQGCWISPDFFRAIGTSIVSGRAFTDHDDATAPGVVVVNQALARAYWPQQNPIGKQIATDYVGPGRGNSSVPVFREVVGVAADVRQKGLEGPIEPAVYMPYLQDQTNHVFAAMNWFVRTKGDPRAIAGTLRPVVHGLRPKQPIENMQTMNQAMFKTMASRRFTLVLFTMFAGLALLLSAIGIFGMIAYSVSLRIPEFGLRMALGAQRSDVRKLVLKEGLLLTTGGIVLGAVIASILTQAMAGLLFGVTPTDPVTFAAAAGLLMIVAGSACLFPAWRAGLVDPMRALTH